MVKWLKYVVKWLKYVAVTLESIEAIHKMMKIKTLTQIFYRCTVLEFRILEFIVFVKASLNNHTKCWKLLSETKFLESLKARLELAMEIIL